MSNFCLKLSDRVARALYRDLEQVFNAITYMMVTEHIAPGATISINANDAVRRAVENYIIYGLLDRVLGDRSDYVLKIPYLTLEEMGSTGKNTIDRLTERDRAAVKTYDIDLSGCATRKQLEDHVLSLYDACVRRQEQAEELEQMRKAHEVSQISVTPSATEAPAASPEVVANAITEQELDSLEEIPDADFEQEQKDEVEQEEELAQEELEGDAHKQMPLVVESEERPEEQAEEEDDTPFDAEGLAEDLAETTQESEVVVEDDPMKALEAILGKKNQ